MATQIVPTPPRTAEEVTAILTVRAVKLARITLATTTHTETRECAEEILALADENDNLRVEAALERAYQTLAAVRTLQAQIDRLTGVTS